VKGLSVRSIALNDPELSALPGERAAAVLETSQDYISYRRAIGKNDVPEPAALARELLTARSQLEAVTQTPGAPVPKVRPDQGHGSSRAALRAGREDGSDFQELQVRATYHDIMDSDDGYARGAQIEFFSLALRNYDFGTTRVEQFTPLHILSLSPRDDFFQPISWKIDAGWHRVRTPDGDEPLVLSLDGSMGGTWSNQRNALLWYALLDGSSRINSDLVNGYALGAGASVGGLFDFNARWRIHGYARSMRYFLGQLDTPAAFGIEQRFTLGSDTALRLDISRNRELQWTYYSGSLSVLFYF
jgi:hypothetical protein